MWLAGGAKDLCDACPASFHGGHLGQNNVSVGHGRSPPRLSLRRHGRSLGPRSARATASRRRVGPQDPGPGASVRRARPDDPESATPDGGRPDPRFALATPPGRVEPRRAAQRKSAGRTRQPSPRRSHVVLGPGLPIQTTTRPKGETAPPAGKSHWPTFRRGSKSG